MSELSQSAGLAGTTSSTSFDPAAADRLKRRAAALSLAAAVVLTAFKLAVGLYTNSLAILSEALHSGLDLVAAAMTWYAVALSSRPADSGHPYGHGKAENLSALAETVLLFAVCIYVGWEGMHRLMEGGEPVLPSLWGVGVMAVSMLVDVNRVRALRKAAKAARSQALEADALHFATDIFASGVVFLGVLAVWLGERLHAPAHIRQIIGQADTVAALLVALLIFKASLEMARNAAGILMDAGSAETQAAVEEAVRAIPGVAELSRLRMRTS
ncbi:MAG: cation transporter, partial [Desulfovibrio sp.]|nr:cation transporter [Desulfovibrio sp.]